jgi:L-asparaginase / beta-aspartyl-peptidase
MNTFSIAIHGGAGTIPKGSLSADAELLYHDGLKKALQAGIEILKDGGSSLNAVVAAVVSLEDNPLFNAGKGSVFNHKGAHEMDASLMEGKNLDAGAVAGISGIKNPIELAMKIMTHSEHVLLSGNGAMEFARLQGFHTMPDDYFYNEYRYKQWKQAVLENKTILDHTPEKPDEKKFGTVGAVALDSHGNLAAATSTGGMTNKRFGRIGDTPLIGCGTYANNNTCAVSCTGHGEFFIRAQVAYDISCLMEYRGLNLKEACREVVKEKLVRIGGEGGIVAVDAQGNTELCFNSEGMYRGSYQSGADIHTAIYED